MLVLLFLLGAALTSSSPAPVQQLNIPSKTVYNSTVLDKSWKGQINNQPLRSICYKFVQKFYTDRTRLCYEYQPDCANVNKTANVADTTPISDANCYNYTTFTTYADVKWDVVLKNFQNSPTATTHKAAAGLSTSLLTLMISTIIAFSRQ